MPISNSAKKALRSSERKNLINRRRKTVLRSALKNVSNDSVNKTFSAIDKAAKWGIIHPNKAARLKSRIGKQFTAPIAEKPKKTTEKKPAKAAKSAPKTKATSKKTKSA